MLGQGEPRDQHQDAAAVQDNGAVFPLLLKPALEAAPSTMLAEELHPLQHPTTSLHPAPRPALILDPASATPLRDPLPQCGDKGPGTARSCRAHLPLPGLCPITGAKIRSCYSNLQRGGRGRGGRGSGQAKAGVSWCTDPGFAGGEIRQCTWSCHPKQSWSAA